MIQDVVLILSLCLMGIVMAVFIKVAVSAGGSALEYPAIQKSAYGIRAKFFWVLVIAGVIITSLTTLDLPYAATRGEMAGVDKVVNVEGRQWYWQIDDSSAKVGETVVFKLTSGDVNHGLGIYNDKMRLVAQGQAMPGFENSLKITFDEPGTYQFLCMEYCGLAHHVMVSNFTVTP